MQATQTLRSTCPAGPRACVTRTQRAAVAPVARVPAATFVAPRVASAASVRASVATAATKTYVGSLRAEGLKFGVVCARFNDLVGKGLLEGAMEAFERHGCNTDADVDVAWVPGSFELPLVAKSMAKSGKYDAVLAIGVVVRGATTHYEEVAGGAASGLMSAGLDAGLPVIFGVLTTETMEQAMDRAGGKLGNKGGEAAITAIEMANVMKDLRADGAGAAW